MRDSASATVTSSASPPDATARRPAACRRGRTRPAARSGCPAMSRAQKTAVCGPACERPRVEAQVQDARPPPPPRRRRSRRPRPRWCRRRRRTTSKRAESPTGCPADGAVETQAGGSRSSRMRPAPVTSSGPGGAMSSALADQLPRDRVGIARLPGGAVALHQQGGRARRVGCRRRRADHRDARPDGGRGRRDDIGLEAAVLGRALRRVGGRGVALPVARAHRERSAGVAGRRDARLRRWPRRPSSTPPPKISRSQTTPGVLCWTRSP